MRFSLIYPRSNSDIRSPVIAFGLLGADVPSVTGRLISYTPFTIIYAIRMDQLAPRFWRLVFVVPAPADTYDLEILDQNGRIIDTAHNLDIATSGENIEINYPTNDSTVCPDLIAVGTTTEDDSVPLRFMRVEKPGGPTVAGVEDLRLGNVWSVRFTGIPQGPGYTLRIGHEVDGSDAAACTIHANISACTPTPIPGPIPGPVPGPGPVPIP